MILHSADFCIINRLTFIMYHQKMKQNVYRQRKLREMDGEAIQETH